MMKKVLDLLDGAEGAEHQKRMESFSEQFAKLATDHGFAGENCRKVCEDHIVFSDGVAHHEVHCRIICTQA